MSSLTSKLLLGSLIASSVSAIALPDVSTAYPYTGPAIPIADWVDQSVKGNGKGFPRLVEPPAVAPATSNPTNNVNVVATSYLPNGINIHFQTPFGLGVAPSIKWGTSASALTQTATGHSKTYVVLTCSSCCISAFRKRRADSCPVPCRYDRTPPCSLAAVTQCSQFFHDVQLKGLASGTTYYYQIQPANGTTVSQIMSVKTARAVGDHSEFSIVVLNDMGYTNAQGTHKQIMNAVADGISFAWHGGDISYADDWYVFWQSPSRP